jgi:hypothetical protein
MRSPLMGVVALFLLVSCGSDSKRPTTPSAPTTPSPTVRPTFPPAGFSVASLQTACGIGLCWAEEVKFAFARQVVLSWSGVSGATSYLIEVGSMASLNDLLVAEVTDTTYSWSAAPVGSSLSARVRAKNAAGSGPVSAPLILTTLSFQDYVEALFLGTGPYGTTDCVTTGLMSGWPGGTVDVVLGALVHRVRVMACVRVRSWRLQRRLHPSQAQNWDEGPEVGGWGCGWGRV